MSPVRPARLCACGARVPGGYPCLACAKKRDATRGNAQQRGYGARHRAWRRMVLNAHPFCANRAQCHSLPSDSDHADHIIPLPQPNWWDGDWSIENGQRLCHTCHNRKTNQERAYA